MVHVLYTFTRHVVGIQMQLYVYKWYEQKFIYRIKNIHFKFIF